MIKTREQFLQHLNISKGKTSQQPLISHGRKVGNANLLTIRINIAGFKRGMLCYLREDRDPQDSIENGELKFDDMA